MKQGQVTSCPSPPGAEASRRHPGVQRCGSSCEGERCGRQGARGPLVPTDRAPRGPPYRLPCFCISVRGRVARLEERASAGVGVGARLCTPVYGLFPTKGEERGAALPLPAPLAPALVSAVTLALPSLGGRCQASQLPVILAASSRASLRPRPPSRGADGESAGRPDALHAAVPATTPGPPAFPQLLGQACWGRWAGGGLLSASSRGAGQHLCRQGPCVCVRTRAHVCVVCMCVRCVVCVRCV